ncbi:hypothetical protein BDW42DRAFT_173536 [Aspergillus taichungensis]|uniref:Uncharacterized protein n=1 Tax=Aspergillus taichungensis TaxID=482145 RepID=A0A2J5HPG3_9EURO|nr:hypothetical protein BDW42DRAFT_173536 [Aspergillus taichungensis]
MPVDHTSNRPYPIHPRKILFSCSRSILVFCSIGVINIARFFHSAWRFRGDRLVQ